MATIVGNSVSNSTEIVRGEYYPDCEMCPKLCNNTVSVCLEGDGPSDADFMILGEAPGEYEDELNRPFVGPSGEYLRDELLVSAYIPESKVRFTNAVRCHPPKNRNPTIREVQKCRSYLVKEIERVKPKVIVGMGNVALATILQTFYKGVEPDDGAKKTESRISGISKWQGKLIWLREFDCWFMPTFHPSYCMRQAQGYEPSYYATELVADDLKVAWDAQHKSPPSKYPRSVYVKDPDRAKEIIKKMWDAGTFAYDIETGGTGKTTNRRIIGASFACSEDVGYYIPWWVFEHTKSLLMSLYTLLGSKKHTKVMHNGAYETRIHRLSQTKTPWWDKYFDTMIAAHAVDENFSKRLKDLAWIYTSVGGYDLPLAKYTYRNKIKEDYSQIPDGTLGPYGGYDAVVTYIIHNRLTEKMAEEKLLANFNKIAMPARRVFSDAEYAGMYMDKDRADELNTACLKAKEILESKIYKCAGTEFNIGSSKQLQQVLFEDMGFKPLKKTKTGYSTDAETLKYLAGVSDAPIAQYLLDRSYIKTMQGTHITQALNYRWDEDGRVHTFYNSTGAVTGRISASRPSLQNVPADRLIRSLYAATPGNILIDADLKSAELATIAAISGERTFVDAFTHGMDPHNATYRQVYGLPDDYIPTKVERRKAKAVNFGMVYGITAIGLAAQLGITPEEAQDFMDLYFVQMPNVAAWMEGQKAFVREHGYVVSPFGRKRRLPLGMSDSYMDVSRAERQAMNSPIQSGAADYTYVGLARLSRAIKREKVHTRIVHTVHDCVVTDGPPEEELIMRQLIKAAFETPVKVLPIGMRVDIEVGTRWGEGNESRLNDILEGVGLSVAA